MPTLKLKFPPPILVLLTASLMWLAARAAPRLAFALPARHTLAACVAIVGLATIVTAAIAFRRVGTTVNPMKPEKASSLVTTGLFKRTRNPMYVGLLLLLIAWAIYLSHALAFIFPPLFIAYMNRFQIGPEEDALSAAFGAEFASYKARVRRWV